MRESLQGVFFGVCWEGKGSERAIFSCLHGLQEHGKGAFLSFARGLQGVGMVHFWGLQELQVKKKGAFLLLHEL